MASRRTWLGAPFVVKQQVPGLGPAGTIHAGRGTEVSTVLAYAIASFADKQLELGAVLLAYYHYGSLRALVLTGLAFQATKVLTFLVRIPPSPRSAAVATVAAVALIHAGRDSLPIFVAGTVVFTAAVSYLRAWTKHLRHQPGNSEGRQKQARDVVRALGFVLAPFFSPMVVGAMTVIALLALTPMTARRAGECGLRYRIAGATEPAHVAMFVHHVHYFTYSHLVPFLFAVSFGLPVTWQGVVFYLGWIGYDLHDFVKVRASWRRFLVGHGVTAGGILILFWAPTPSLAALGWLFTGIGGGTYVMLRQLTSADDPDPGENLELAEHYGHVAGVVVLVGLVASSVTFPAIGVAAAVLALMSPLLALSMRARPRRRLAAA